MTQNNVSVSKMPMEDVLKQYPCVGNLCKADVGFVPGIPDIGMKLNSLRGVEPEAPSISSPTYGKLGK